MLTMMDVVGKISYEMYANGTFREDNDYIALSGQIKA